MKEETYDIGGMHCASCAASIERVTRKLDGVESCDVNLAMNRMTISYDEEKVTPELIESKIEKAGFSAALRAEKKEIAPDAVDEAKGRGLELIVMAAFSAALLFVSMGTMLFKNLPVPRFMDMDVFPVNFALTQLLLAVPIMFLGRRFFVSGFKSLFAGHPNMDALVAISCTASLAYSVVMTYLISANAHYAHELYFESAAVVLTLVSLGKFLEARSTEKTKGAIKKLMELAPETALLIRDGGQWEVPSENLKVGDMVLVKAGMKFPRDGLVSQGGGSADESMLTGESMPVQKDAGSVVIGGSICVSGAVYVEITKVGEDTVLAKIIKFVEDAQGKKAPISKTADKVAGVFVPVVIAIAVLAAVIWVIAGQEASFALKIFTTVLVIACPCAMGLATPTAIMVGTGLGAGRGILIRNGEALEAAHETQVVILDKTGTVTEGKPRVTRVLPAEGTEEELLAFAAALERLSDHPLAKAICNEAERREISSDADVTELETISGMGVAAQLGGKRIAVGNAELLSRERADISALEREAEELASQGQTVVFVSWGGRFLGLLSIADTVKETSSEAVGRLRKMGIETVLLTGDNRRAAEYISGLVGTDRVISEVLPEDKAQVVKRYQAEGKKVMMVGDGINDAPALVQAETGCAIGGGSDIAIESADIILMKSDLADVPRAIELSRLTIRNIRQNLFWAFCYNVLGIPIAAGVLFPAFGLLLTPVVAALAMSLSSVFVVTNALRLRGKKL